MVERYRSACSDSSLPGSLTRPTPSRHSPPRWVASGDPKTSRVCSTGRRPSPGWRAPGPRSATSSTFSTATTPNSSYRSLQVPFRRRVTDESYETMARRITDAVAAGADAVFLSLHGAMVTDSHDDAEGELLRRIRHRSRHSDCGGPRLPPRHVAGTLRERHRGDRIPHLPAHRYLRDAARRGAGRGRLPVRSNRSSRGACCR